MKHKDKKEKIEKKKFFTKDIKDLSVRDTVTIGVVFIVVGVVLILGKSFLAKKSEVYDKINVSIAEIEEIEEPTNPEENAIQEEKQEQEQQAQPDYYIGKLEIPKISFSRGFAAIDSIQNNVDKNIKIMPQSTYPDVDKGNFIIVGHSGNGWNSFFKNLYQLAIGDQAYVYYGNRKFTYTIVNIYNVPKTGQVEVVRDRNESVMTLITCTKGDKTAQTVYILNRTAVE